jgi:hypothetical protein
MRRTICDGVDNDCDGEVDDGLATLTCGTGACLRTVDTCNRRRGGDVRTRRGL